MFLNWIIENTGAHVLLQYIFSCDPDFDSERAKIKKNIYISGWRDGEGKS
jgi:hypothetical protein